jgi:hypothetical protein
MPPPPLRRLLCKDAIGITICGNKASNLISTPNECAIKPEN